MRPQQDFASAAGVYGKIQKIFPVVASSATMEQTKRFSPLLPER